MNTTPDFEVMPCSPNDSCLTHKTFDYISDDDDLVSQDTETTILTNNHTKSPKKLTHTDSNFSIR